MGYITGTLNSAGNPTGGNGDLVFDQEGNLLFVSSTNSIGQLWRISGLSNALAGAPKAQATSIDALVSRQKLTDLAANGQFNGVTFDNDGYLYGSYTKTVNGVVQSYIQKLDPNTGAAAGLEINVTGLGVPDSRTRTVVDLADCNDPGGIRLQKDYPLGRVASGDNVTLNIVRQDRPTTALAGGTATTNGPVTGLQTNAAAVVIGVPGNNYVLSETISAGSPLTDYTTTMQCVDKTHGNASIPVTQNSQGEYVMAFPGVTAADGQLLANVVCTYTNTPKPKIAVDKVGSTQCLAPGATPTDVAYTYTVTNPGAVPLRNVTLVDDKGTTTFVSGDTNGDGLLDPGESWVYRMTSAVTTATTNTATVTGVSKSNGEVATATDTWTVAPSAVTVNKTSNATGPVKAGDELTYTMTVTNTGTTDATNVVLTDQLPAGVTYVADSAQKTYMAGSSATTTKTGTYTTTLPNFSFSDKVGYNQYELQTLNTVGLVPANAQLTGYTVTLKGSSGYNAVKDVAVIGYLPGQPVNTTFPTTTGSWFSVAKGGFGSSAYSGVWNTVTRSGAASGTASGQFTFQWGTDYTWSGYYNTNTASGTTVTLNYSYADTTTSRAQVTDAAHAPGEMVSAADAVTLKSGETMTVTFKVTVDDPLDPAITELTNTALVTYSGDEACAAGGSVTDPVQGAPATPIHVEKQGKNCDVGQGTCALNGAQFALYDTDPSVAGATPIVDGITADDVNGATFTSKTLQAGTYWLVETKAPTGFTLLPKPIQFTIASTGITLSDPVDGIVSLKDGDAFTIVVSDTSPAPLPEAGGAGPWPFYAVGLLLLVGAGLYHQMTSVRRVAP